MASVHHVLLLWFDFPGLCLPSLLFVSEPFETFLTDDSYHHHSALLACSFSQQNSMRYSRMLEESSFANRKADYFWLLFLSSLMLLVRLPPPSLTHPSSCDISFIPRAYPRYSTSPSSPPRSPTCPSTSGRAGTPRRPSHSLVCSPSPRRTFPLLSSPSPGCSRARGARRQAISSDVRWAT